MPPTRADLDDLDVTGGVSIRVRPAVFTYPPGATFGPRVLHDFEFIWVIRGRADWIRLDEPEQVVLEPGALLLVQPGTRDLIRWSQDEPTTHGYVHFAIDPRPSTVGWPQVRRHAIAPSPLPALLDYLVWLAELPSAASTEHAEAALATVLHTFVSGPLPDPAEHREPAPLAAALDYAREAWSRRVRPIALDELSAVAGVSGEHLARLCRHHYGCSLVGALELARLDLADELLTRTNLSVTEIARSCGYDDPLYFSRRFRTHYGASPRAYRQGSDRRSALDTSSLQALAARVRPGALGAAPTP
jgi:AraC-like DNA-binding protein